MPLTKIQFAPGIHKEGTQYTTGPSWYDCDKIRFRKGRPEQIGGWVKPGNSVIFPAAEVLTAQAGSATGEETTSFRGVARSLFDWSTAGAAKYLGIGTNLKFYVELGGQMSDITPLRETTAAGAVTFAAVNGSSVLTVTDASHGATAGDYVTFTDATTLGGTIVADVLNNEYEIATIINTNSYTIIARDINQTIVVANASDTSDGNDGTGTIGAYQIATGTNTFVPATGWSVDTWGTIPWGGGGSLTFANQLRQYSQDVFGDDLIFNPRAGGVYYWDESGGTENRAISLAELSVATYGGTGRDAPVAALQVMVSPIDRHVIAFGANALGVEDGSLDPSLVRWSDQENAADWTPTATNSSGGQVLSSGTAIIGAVKTRQEILIFTDTTIHAMRFSGSPFVFQFAPVGENITILSPRAAVSTGDAVFFMDLEGFYIYQGSTTRLPCTVLDFVYLNLNKTQLHKTFALNDPDHDEVTWFYQSTAAGVVDVDRYVSFNYSDQTWVVGSLARGAWIQAPTKTYPVATSNDTSDVKNNYLYEQEQGTDADGQNMGAYIESGDMEAGDGESFIFMTRFIPDFRYKYSDAGVPGNVDITVTIKGRDFPLDDFLPKSTSTVVYNTKQKHVRVRAREIAMRIESNNTGYSWTMGDFRFQMRTSGRR